MPRLPQPATALRDRAERHVFAALPELGAVERRALAIVELTGAARDEAASDTALDAEALAVALAAGRRALRRTRAPLASGARCDRSERLLSDRLDTTLDRHARKWLEIHLARCPRCDEHERLLAAARAELHAGFSSEPPAPPTLPPAAEPPALEPAARLRLVPAAATPEPEAEPAATPEPAPTPEPDARRRSPRRPPGPRRPPIRPLPSSSAQLSPPCGPKCSLDAPEGSRRPRDARRGSSRSCC